MREGRSYQKGIWQGRKKVRKLEVSLQCHNCSTRALIMHIIHSLQLLAEIREPSHISSILCVFTLPTCSTYAVPHSFYAATRPGRSKPGTRLRSLDSRTWFLNAATQAVHSAYFPETWMHTFSHAQSSSPQKCEHKDMSAQKQHQGERNRH